MIEPGYDLTTVSFSWYDPDMGVTQGGTSVVSGGWEEDRTPPVIGFFPTPATVKPKPVPPIEKAKR